MSQPKLFLHGETYFITFRTEEDLPFVAIPLINEILWSIVAKAQGLYSQELVALTVEPNHCHSILRCLDPETVPAFIGYIKQESAHAINALIGRKKKTIWAAGYDSPILLDHEKFLDKLAYTLLNPVKDQLVPTMDKYKSVSTWEFFMKNQSERPVRLFSRSSITALGNPNKPWNESAEKLKELSEKNPKMGQVKFNFYSWKKCFPETRSLTDSEIRQLILKKLKSFEEKIKGLLPPKKFYRDMSQQSMLQSYTPKRHGKRMICLSNYKELRIDFLNFFFEKVGQAREVFSQWKAGNLAAKFPLGMFAPRLPRTANLLVAL